LLPFPRGSHDRICTTHFALPFARLGSAV
jgi:hypothetical protein